MQVKISWRRLHLLDCIYLYLRVLTKDLGCWLAIDKCTVWTWPVNLSFRRRTKSRYFPLKQFISRYTVLVGVPLQYNLTSILKISVENNSRYKDDNGMSTIAHFIKNANFKFISLISHNILPPFFFMIKIQTG